MRLMNIRPLEYIGSTKCTDKVEINQRCKNKRLILLRAKVL